VRLHAKYGGVVPEIASRFHLEYINFVVKKAIRKARISLKDIELVAVTAGPGLPGSLLVGVSFARALAREPRVLLLDEATSSVDPVTEGRIQEALAGILPGRTALVVAHRLSTVLSAGRIIVMHKGKVRESGTHAELMAAGGIYRRLYALQFEEGG